MPNINIKNALYAAIIIAIVAGCVQLSHVDDSMIHFSPHFKGL